MNMSNPREAVDALDHLRQHNFIAFLKVAQLADLDLMHRLVL